MYLLAIWKLPLKSNYRRVQRAYLLTAEWSLWGEEWRQERGTDGFPRKVHSMCVFVSSAYNVALIFFFFYVIWDYFFGRY